MTKGIMKALAVSALLIGASGAFAELVGDVFHVQVCDDAGLCVGSYVVANDKAVWDPEILGWVWELEQDTQITEIGEPSNVLADILVTDPNTPGSRTCAKFLPPIEGVRSDPRVDLNFVLRAGSTASEFTITSSLMTFPTMSNPSAKSSVGISVTDRSRDANAVLSPLVGNNSVSYSYVNGLPSDPGVSQFSELLQDDIVVATVGGTQTGLDAISNWTPVGMPVSSISAEVEFSLTARDLASGASTFVIPEPCSLLLLAGMALVTRRR